MWTSLLHSGFFPLRIFLILVRTIPHPQSYFLTNYFYHLFNDFFQLPANGIDPVHEANLHLKSLYMVVKNTGCGVKQTWCEVTSVAEGPWKSLWISVSLPVNCFSHSVVSDSFATPRTVACQTPPSMGFPRQEYWSGLPFPSPGDPPDPGIEPHLLHWRQIICRREGT